MEQQEKDQTVHVKSILYSRQDMYEEDGEQVWGNWNASPEAACGGMVVARSTLVKAVYTFTKIDGCAQGGGLVRAAS